MGHGDGLEILGTAEMREADRLTIADGTPGILLMERAGRAVANVCSSLLGNAPAPGLVAVLCGPGNNGGDGFVAARLLQASGIPVALYRLGQEDASGGDAALAAQAWTGPVMAIDKADFRDVALIVDALFGAGLSRPIEGLARAVIEAVNASGRPVLAIDVPSGTDGDTGTAQGITIRASHTVTFFRPKHGHYLDPGRDNRGVLTVADIGIDAAVLGVIDPKAALNRPKLWLGSFPWPKPGGHKYKRGHAVVVSGGLSHTGAARLSARAALRVGAGLVTLASPTDALSVNAAHLTAIMLHAADGADGLGAMLQDTRKNSVVLGPGLGVGAETRTIVGAALAQPAEPPSDEHQPRSVVLDADALTSFAGDASALAALIAEAPGAVVITPHDGEFARLFEGHPDVLDPASKLDRARAAARLLGCVILYKGSDTVVASPDGRAALAAEDAPWLATAGSGDVLSGLIGGLLAQSMPVFEATCAAAAIHVAAARSFGPGLIAEDIPEAVPAVLRSLYEDQAFVTSNQQRNPPTH